VEARNGRAEYIQNSGFLVEVGEQLNTLGIGFLRRRMMKKKPTVLLVLVSVLICWALVPGVSPASASKTLMVYTAANEKLHADVVAAFNKKYPKIKVKTVNLSTGPITEKAIVEKANPQADVIYAVNTIALEQLKNAGALEPYSSKGSKIPTQFADPDGFYVNHWLTLMVMAVNTKILKEKNLPIPKGWEDLIKPKYKGLITVAAPTKSGTGLTIFTTLFDAFGWNYIDNLHHNIFQYNSSGGAAGRQAGSGETAIGLTYDTVVLDQIKAGLPVELVFPTLTPNVMEGGGLILGAPNPNNGKLFLDFLASAAGAKVYAPYVGAATAPGLGNIDLMGISLWKMRRPVDASKFKRKWAKKYEK
jgi:iron(III) transport system substrate-binding protein